MIKYIYRYMSTVSGDDSHKFTYQYFKDALTTVAAQDRPWVRMFMILLQFGNVVLSNVISQIANVKIY